MLKGALYITATKLELAMCNYFIKVNKLFYLFWSNPNPNKDNVYVETKFYSDRIFFSISL